MPKERGKINFVARPGVCSNMGGGGGGGSLGGAQCPEVTFQVISSSQRLDPH